MRFSVLALVAAAIVSSPVIAQDQPAAQAAPAKKDDGDKKVCRKIRNTGSRLGGQIECHSKREWDAMSSAAQTDVRGMPSNTPR